MTGPSIVAAERVVPGWRAGTTPVEGPDEDAFTLAVAALERLADRAGTDPLPSHLELVGELPGDADALLGEALGDAALDVRHHAATAEGLGRALVAAAGPGSPERDPGRRAVVVVDVAAGRPERAAAAVGLLVAPGDGARIDGYASRSHPADRPPDAARWVDAAGRAQPGLGGDGPRRAVLLAAAAPPVLLAEVERAFPGVRTMVAPWIEPGTAGRHPATRAASVLVDAAADGRPGERVVVAAVDRERTDLLGLTVGETPLVPGGTAAAERGRPTPDGRPFDSPVLGDGPRSEGAYVARARYLENLPARWRFVGERCGACGATTFPPAGRCRACGRADALGPRALPRRGLVVDAATTVGRGAQPTEFDGLVERIGAYAVVLAEWPGEGVRVTLQVADAEPGSVRIGDAVATQLRRLYPLEGAWRYGRKAVLLPPDGADVSRAPSAGSTGP